MNGRTLIFTIRIAASIAILMAVIALSAQLRSIANDSAATLLPPFILLTFGCGLGMALFGIAAILSREPKISTSLPNADLAQNQLIELSIKVDELATALDRLANHTIGSPASYESAAAPEAAESENDRLHALEQQLNVVRDLVLLPDEQRHRRWLEGESRRKEIALQAAASLVQARQWSEAENAIAELESEWQSDPVLSAIRNDLKLARATAQRETVERVQSEIESAMSLSRWEEASDLAHKLAADFPTSAAAARLVKRVEREGDLYTEKTVQRLYEDIRRDIERRVWRRALEHSQTLMEKFPTHPRSELVRKQIKTIGDNAEIEERQEQELRIGELIRARRFQEGVELSEELLVRFPSSPQAVAIEKMLPKIRQLAADAESAARDSSSL